MSLRYYIIHIKFITISLPDQKTYNNICNKLFIYLPKLNGYRKKINIRRSVIYFVRNSTVKKSHLKSMCSKSHHFLFVPTHFNRFLNINLKRSMRYTMLLQKPAARFLFFRLSIQISYQIKADL